MNAGTMMGSDPESLELAAGQLDNAAQALDDSAVALAKTLGSLSWLGQVAIRFSDAWNGGHKKRVAVTSGFLRDAAFELRKQAKEQRDASAGDDAAWKRGLPGGSRFLTPGMLKLIKQLEGMQLRTHEEQVAWWNSLTDVERQMLLDERFADLIALHGLPADVIDQAYKNYFADMADGLETSSDSISGEIEIKVVGVDVGVGFDAEMTVYRNGSVKIDISETIKAGLSEQDSKAAASLGLGGTFEFESEAEAREWITNLERAAARGDVLGFLKESSAHLGSVRIEGGGEGSIGAGGVSIKAEAGVSATLDTRGEGEGNVTVSAHGSLSGKAGAGAFGVSGNVDASVSATFVGGVPKSITFELGYEGAAMEGVFSPVASLSVGATHSGTAEITFDLTRPEIAAIAPQLAAAITQGDIAGAAQLATSVMNQAEVVLRTTVGTQSTTEVGGTVLGTGFKAEYSTSSSVTTSTYVKPPNGEFREVK